MDIKKLNKFVALAKEAGVAELKYENGDEKYFVKLGEVAPMYASAPTMAPQGLSQVENSAPSKNDGLLEVTSPFVGTFYKSSSPDAPAYAKKGDNISSGKVLCIVEAMKIMNEIESEISGEIVEVCVENETYVEFGQVLFRVKP
jgi:acetyl-CoA carboxylase biotin carboxyl carrier protein